MVVKNERKLVESYDSAKALQVCFRADSLSDRTRKIAA